MEKAILNVKELKVTQGMNGSYSHKGDLAIDISSVCKYLKAPFTGTIKRIYKNCNAVWLQSNEKVKYADGTEDYMTIMTIHDNDVSNLKVGQVIKQGEEYYHPGVKGNCTGAHIHLAIGKGKFTGNGWTKNKYGYWCINNQYDITKGLFIDESVKQTKPMYNWVVAKEEPKEPVKKELKFKIGDEVILNGYLYKTSNSTKPSSTIKNKKTQITKISEKSKHQYNTTGNLGWMDESSIKLNVIEYYPKTSYKGGSIVDGLKSIKVDSSFNNRKKIAKANGIGIYLSLGSQNIKLLKLLKNGKLIKP